MVNEFDKLKAGKLLIASANMLESNFKRTVLVMCEHNEKARWVLFSTVRWNSRFVKP